VRAPGFSFTWHPGWSRAAGGDGRLLLTDDAVLLVDWLNLSISLKNQNREFSRSVVTGLVKLAEDQCARRGVRLARAYFVGERFEAEAEAAMRSILVAEPVPTRTAKEQADLAMAVLAMDRVHHKDGCPRFFLLATGDQDFVPLIKRIVDENAEVGLIVASTAKLSPAYLEIAAQPNVELLVITDHVDIPMLAGAPADKAGGLVLGLLRVCLAGGILGGAQDRNTQLMAQWGLLPPGTDHAVQMETVLREFTRTDVRQVAHPGSRDTGNVPRTMRRTSLDFAKDAVMSTVIDADWVLRRLATAGRPLPPGELAVGHFGDDSGGRLAAVVSALKAVGWLVERADGGYSPAPAMEWPRDGLLAPLWRVTCEVSRRAYDRHAGSVSRDELFRDLRNTPIAHDQERRGGKAAHEVITAARSLGVLDTVIAGAEGYGLQVIDRHPVAAQATGQLRALGRLLGPDVGRFVPEHEMLSRMQEYDERSARPVFGTDVRDRRGILRILSRASLAEHRRDTREVKVKGSAWLRALVS
jgi:NYN domain